MISLISWHRLAQLGPFRWGALRPWRAGRVALGIAIPLAAGWLTGHIEYGAFMALGALPAGFASLQGETRSRVVAIAGATTGMAISTFVGATVAAGAPWLLPLIVAIWAYLTGLSVCLGPVVSVAVLQWPVALLIAIGLPLGPEEAALRAALVMAGGLLQGILVALSWVLRRGARERIALAASYRAMAGYASSRASGAPAAPPPDQFPAGSALDDPNPLLRGREQRLFVDLLEQAERVRASLAALAAYTGDADAADTRAFLSETSLALALVADALAAPPAGREALVDQLGNRVSRLTIGERVSWSWSGEALLSELRIIVGMLRTLESPRHGTTGRAPALPAVPKELGSLAGAATQLRANVTMKSEAGRHALRLAIVAALAELLVQATGLYQGRWVVLTIFIVLKPDYNSTLNRGVHRALGTILGALLAALIAQLVHPHEGWLVIASAIAAGSAFALFEVNYFLFAVPLTGFIVLLLALIGMPAMASAEARAIDTFIGAAFALAAYIGWPTWLGATAEQQFAALIVAHRDYAKALLREFADSGSVGPARLRALQTDARRARSNAEAAAARLADEPPHPPLTPELAQLLITAAARLAHAELALHALVLSQGGDRVGGDVARAVGDFSVALATTMTATADALRSLRPPLPVPLLRPIHRYLVLATDLRTSPIIDIADRLGDATNTLHDTLRERLPTRMG